MAKRVADRAAAPSGRSSTSTTVEPSADTPAGIGSSPTVGSCHAPSTDRTGPPKPGWTTRSSMRLFGRFGVTVTR